MQNDPDTTYWYPMRVTYGREMRLKAFLDGKGIETFLPMTTRVSKTGGHIRHERVPAIGNLLFVHASRNVITTLKHGYRDAEPLRFMTRPASTERNAPNEIIIVPDRQMENFMKVAIADDDQRTFLSTGDMRGRSGVHVVIANGPFAGVEGVIKRVRGNRRVVVEIEGVAGVCVNFVPRAFLIKKDN